MRLGRARVHCFGALSRKSRRSFHIIKAVSLWIILAPVPNVGCSTCETILQIVDTTTATMTMLLEVHERSYLTESIS